MNEANAVLSDPTKRRDYDADLLEKFREARNTPDPNPPPKKHSAEPDGGAAGADGNRSAGASGGSDSAAAAEPEDEWEQPPGPPLKFPVGCVCMARYKASTEWYKAQVVGYNLGIRTYRVKCDNVFGTYGDIAEDVPPR